MKRKLIVLVALAIVLLLSGCGDDRLPDNDALEAAFAQGRTGVWLSGHGTVVRELSAEDALQRFQVRINTGLSLIVVHRIGGAGRVPVERGDTLIFHGRYEFHGAGGELALTHADPSQPGGGGWLRHQGVLYN